MTQTLYRKYRPTQFADVVGQEHVTTTLVNQLKNNRVAHAYLFAGPRGVGKTTTARLLAKAVNAHNPKTGEPDETSSIVQMINNGTLLDLVEIDGASNRRIDEIRELREHVKYPPNTAKYKVFIIDEVHMLTTEAFNALLKTLEEPPAYVIFILATTELHKLPETIVSRCQCFDFHLVAAEELLKRLSVLCKQESITVEEAVLRTIVKLSGGSVRDAESLLGQIISLGSKKITTQEAQAFLPQTTGDVLVQLWQCMVDHNLSECISVLNNAVADGVEVRMLFDDWLELLRHILLYTINPNKQQQVYVIADSDVQQIKESVNKTSPALVQRYIDVFLQYKPQLTVTTIPQLPFELALVACIQPDESTHTNTHTNHDSPAPPAQHTNTHHSQTNTHTSDQGGPSKIFTQILSEDERWPAVISEIEKNNAALAQYIRNATLTITKKSCVITLGHSFHFDILKKPKHQAIVQQVVQTIYKTNLPLQVVLEEAVREKIVSYEDSLAQQFAQEFGGAVIEE